MCKQEPTDICKNKKPANRANTRSAGSISIIALFPLNRRGRFTRNVVHNAVDVVYFVYDAAGDFIQYVVGDSGPVGGHEIRRRNAAEG